MRKQILTVMMATLMVCAFVGTASATSYFNSKSYSSADAEGFYANANSGASSDGKCASAYGHGDAVGFNAKAQTCATAYNDVPLGAGASTGAYAEGDCVESDSGAYTDGCSAVAGSSAKASSYCGGVTAESGASAWGITGAGASSTSSAEKGCAETESCAGTGAL